MRKMNAVATLMVITLLGPAGAAWAVPEVSAVTMTQRANSRIVDVGYTLSDEAAIITLGIETNGVAIPDSAVTWLSGDVSTEVQPGTGKSIVWNAGADWPEQIVSNARARVTAWCTNAPPQVMVVDLTDGPSANSYPVAYYTSLAALPGGVTNAIYKSSYLVLNKILKGLFGMGEIATAKPVTLSQDFYTGVYQVTQRQWALVMGNRPANFNDESSWAFRPVEQVSYHDIRENPDSNTAITPNWPQTNVVGPNSFMGKLRSKTGLAGFDLPTEAQWEYACRAGTTSYYNDGIGGTPDATSNPRMNVLGRYKSNGGYVGGVTAPAVNCGPENGTAIVGSYLPNAWGLYDTHGNVWEWCLDWYGNISGGIDPLGAVSGASRVKRGGCWNFGAADSRSAFRIDYGPPSYQYSYFGFRLVMNIAQ